MSIFKKMFSIRESVKDFSVLQTDLHSHLIPGIDDGSRSLEDSLSMIRQLSLLGYSKLITTPHIMSDYYRNTPEIILNGLDTVRTAIAQNGIPIEIDAAAEYYVDFEFEKKIGNEKLLTFGKNYLLIEFPMFAPPERMEDVLFKLQLEGYRPVLAHPERYTYWQTKLDVFSTLKDRGVLFQLNLMSLIGHYQEAPRKLGIQLIKEGFINFVGTDTHTMEHTSLVKKTLKEKHIVDLLKSDKLLNSTL